MISRYDPKFSCIIGVNLKGVYLGCKYAIPEITNAGGGTVINVSSLAGLLGVGNVHAYTAAKGGVISLTRAIATGYAAKNIRCGFGSALKIHHRDKRYTNASARSAYR